MREVTIHKKRTYAPDPTDILYDDYQQEWLRHSEFATTAKFYAHLNVKAKFRVARKMEQGLDLSNNKKIKSYRFNRKLSIA
ncbi:hypothetical protein [Diplocloster hominis]|uniref:hypothetical protein n=1 Tax=Diplocloster hominis TaxID=3079010 RepID=UPI0031BA7804